MVKINDKEYELVENSRDGFEKEAVEERLTDYFDSYDYIVGDWSYGKLRLKGFNDKVNKKLNKINDYRNLEDYIQNYCAYGCKYFVLKRINVDKY